MSNIIVSEPCGLALSKAEFAGEVTDRLLAVEEDLVVKLDQIGSDRVSVVVKDHSRVFVQNQRDKGFVLVSVSGDSSETFFDCPAFELDELV